MYITDLTLQNFRNYESLHLTLSQGINLFYGDNAQGKTNILEAIYLCALARSHRTKQEKELIQWTQKEAYVSIKTQKKYLESTIDFKLTPRSKSIYVNKLPIRKLGELLGNLYVVMFSPEDLQLIKDSPKERRRFLDMELCQLDRRYYQTLRNYHKVLKQRNLTLKLQDNNMLDVWDMQLSQYGIEIIERRSCFVKEMNAIGQEIHGTISNYREAFQMLYKPNVSSEAFMRQLSKNREKDKIKQITSVGPHRDDIQFLINDKDARLYASQGQQRTIVLVLKLAELELIKNHIGETPVLLLDDVLSELDEKRQKDLFQYTKNTQTLMTCAENYRNWHEQPIAQIYYVAQNQVFLQKHSN